MRGLVSLSLWIGAVSLCHADPLFESHVPLNIRLEAPLQSMARDRASEPQEHAGSFSYTEADGTLVRFAILVRPRGKNRRLREVCQFPPLRLNFKKGEVKGTLFKKQDKLKLVTHCASMASKSTRASDHLWLEYLAYRIYNQITDKSFRVRPLVISYLDTKSQREYAQPGFLIESNERLAHRLDTNVFEQNAIHPRELHDDSQLVELLQYLLGNTDFSLIRGPQGDRCCHNMLLMGETPQFLPVPYDFDITGFVNRPGSVPAEGLGIRRVTQRIYRGFCREPALLEQAVARYVDERVAIVTLIEEQATLSDSSKSKARKFLDRFYDTLGNPKDFERRIVKRCR
ncbi:MAG: hypothetical protein O7C67_05675 [Gammaproteobacteria bacterium]|nr:hypothetical protein [Gammaproteobacteria bacterium]